MDFFHFHGIPAFWRSIPVRSQVVLLGKFAHFLPFVLTLEQKNLLGKKKQKEKKGSQQQISILCGSEI